MHFLKYSLVLTMNNKSNQILVTRSREMKNYSICGEKVRLMCFSAESKDVTATRNGHLSRDERITSFAFKVESCLSLQTVPFWSMWTVHVPI